jgi:hypothetical protein
MDNMNNMDDASDASDVSDVSNAIDADDSKKTSDPVGGLFPEQPYKKPINMDEILDDDEMFLLIEMLTNLINKNNKLRELLSEASEINDTMKHIEAQAINKMQLQNIEKITVGGVNFSVDNIERWNIKQDDLERFKEIFMELGEGESLKQKLFCHWRTINRVLDSYTKKREKKEAVEMVEQLGAKFSEWSALKFKGKVKMEK